MKWINQLISGLFLAIIKFYQWGLSPLIGPACRYQPTCSRYTAEAIRKYGPWKGSIIGIKRISRCHPWGGHGYDPVP